VRDSSIALSRNVAQGTSNVTLLKGTITAKSAVTVEDPSFAYTFNSAFSNASTVFDTIYLKIGSTVMTATAPSALNTKIQFSGLATVNGTVDVEMYAKVKDTATEGKTFKIDTPLALATFDKKEYVSNQNTIQSSVGSIAGLSIDIVKTGLNITRTDGLGTTKIAAGSKDVVLNELTLAVTKGNPVSISNATYEITYTPTT